MPSVDTIVTTILQKDAILRDIPVAKIRYDFSGLSPESKQRLGVAYLENVLGLSAQTVSTLLQGKNPVPFEPDYDGFMATVRDVVPGAALDLESFGRIAELYASHILGGTLDTAAEAAERCREMDWTVKYFQARREAMAAQCSQRDGQKLKQFWTEISQVIQLQYTVGDSAVKGLPEVDRLMSALQESGFKFFDEIFGNGLTPYRWPYVDSTDQTRQ